MNDDGMDFFNIWTLLILAAGLVILIVVTVMNMFKRLRADLLREVQTRCGGQTLLRQGPANFFGLASKGGKQIRGNGALVLTDQQLLFVLLVPRRVIAVPLETIRDVSLTRGHCGKTIFRDLLKVEFSEADGTDSIAWSVQDPDKWVEDIKKSALK